MLNYLPAAFGPSYQYDVRIRLAGRPVHQLPQRELYALLRALYSCNGLYQVLQESLYDTGVWSPAMRPLRCPAYRVVELHASKLLTGELEVDGDNVDRIEPSIRKVWKWSNWDARKLVWTRQLAMLGDAFLKVVVRDDRTRVYFQLIDADHVSEFDVDERGYLTYIRVDIPQVARENDETRHYWHTEVWDKATMRFRLWQHEQALDTGLDRLGPPLRSQPFSDFGIDFVPFVWAPFRDIGEGRGTAAIMPAFDKIDEANRQATRLHQMLFRHNRPTFAVLANQVDPSGRPVPAARLDGRDNGNVQPQYDDHGRRIPANVSLGDDDILYLPGNNRLEQLVPNVNYSAALEVLNAMMAEIEKDLPELAYYDLRTMGQVSGYAVKLLLGDAVDRILEARGNAEAALVRADQMALTLGAVSGIFQNIGSYEQGDFDHTFKPREVFPASDLEVAQAELAKGQALKAWTDAGLPLTEALRRVGYNDDEIVRILDESTAEAAANPRPQPPTDVVPPVAQ